MTNCTRRGDKPASAPPSCLERPIPSTQRGRTLIAPDVHTLAEHRRRLADPDGYRPRVCPCCGHAKLHVHDYRPRVLRADPEAPETRIVRYRCMGCRGTFRILPAFLAQNLWRTYQTLEQETLAERPSPTRPVVPYRTAHRWRARLGCHLGAIHPALVRAKHPLAELVGQDEPRRRFVLVHAQENALAGAARLFELAALVQRIEPGLRLM